MTRDRFRGDSEASTLLDEEQSRLLTAEEERGLLRELARCKAELSEALAQIPGYVSPPLDATPQEVSQQIATFYGGNPRGEARLASRYHRYNELRSKLAMANVRLVAHIAKRFRDRGVAYSDLMQDGFCGLLEAIDRFDLGHETKLATYATWWIRQAIQRSVASGAYPVRLSPRHLRQLAQNQEEIGRQDGSQAPSSRSGSPDLIRRIHAATRPAVSLDAAIDSEQKYSLIQSMSDPEGDRTLDVDSEESLARLMGSLPPREQEVLALRYGLHDGAPQSLSQVGKVMKVSKERVRQIQDRALQRLRAAVKPEELEAQTIA